MRRSKLHEKRSLEHVLKRNSNSAEFDGFTTSCFSYENNCDNSSTNDFMALDEEIREYFVNALMTLKEGVVDEEKRVFIENVLDQSIGRELQLSCQKATSQCLELLFDENHDLEILTRFMDAFSKDFKSACGNCYASHITEALLYYGLKNMQTWTADVEDCEKNENAKKVTFIISWIYTLGEFCLDNLQTCLEDNYGCHVLRTVIQTLGGYYLSENRSKHERKKKKSFQFEYMDPENNLKEKETIELNAIPKFFTTILKRMTKYFLKLEDSKIIVYAVQPQTGPVFQLLLYVLRKRLPKHCKKLISVLYSSLFKEKTKEGIPKALAHKNCSYVVEKIFEFASEEQQSEVWKVQIEPYLTLLIPHLVSNFVLQRMFDLVQSKSQFELMCLSMFLHFHLIFKSNHYGIWISMASACIRLETQQGQFLTNLVQCFDCETMESQKFLVSLLLNFQNFKKFDRKSPLKSATLHGSLLIQYILKFHKPHKIVESMLNMKSADLMFLACHTQGCHILINFFSSKCVGEKNKDRLIQILKPVLTSLACDRNGNLTLSRIWCLLTLKQKSGVVEELLKNHKTLQQNSNGFGISKKFGLYYYKSQREEWKKFQENLSKKRTF